MKPKEKILIITAPSSIQVSWNNSRDFASSGKELVGISVDNDFLKNLWLKFPPKIHRWLFTSWVEKASLPKNTTLLLMTWLWLKPEPI